MRRNPLSHFILLSSLLLNNTCWALQTDRQQPIKVEADKASIEKQSGTSTYNGNVVVRQGSMRISADTLTITTHQGKFQKMVAQGNPTTFQQKTDSKHKSISSSARKITFLADKDIVIFEKNAVLKQGKNTFSSNRIVYDIKVDQVNAGKQSGGDRVTITIQPVNDEPGVPVKKP